MTIHWDSFLSQTLSLSFAHIIIYLSYALEHKPPLPRLHYTCQCPPLPAIGGRDYHIFHLCYPPLIHDNTHR